MGGRHAASSEHPSRHAAAGSGNSRRPLIVIVVVIVVALLGGGAGWAAIAKPPPGDAAAMSATRSASPKELSTAPPAKVINCREQVRAGDRAVTSAKKSYKDWYEHVHAQFDLDKGKITLAKANQIWDRTHKLGSDDMASFDGNYIVWKNQRKACSKVPTKVPARFANRVRDCKARAKVIAKTLAAGRAVADDWEKHTLEERQKSKTDPYEYHKLWIGLVHKAPKHLKAFRKQEKLYKKAPLCFPDQGK